MIKLSKLFVAPAIESTTNPFKTAQIRLTVLYTLIFGVLVLILSLFLYKLFAADIHEDMVSIYGDTASSIDIINQHKIPLRNYLIKLDLGIMLFIIVVSYYLSQFTLRPIQLNYEAEKRFITNASHELRTPLAILRSDIEVSLLDRHFPRSLRPSYLSFLDEIDNMKLIIENMLMLFRFESRQIVLHPEKVSLSLLLKQDIKRLNSYALTHGIIINSHLESRVYCHLDKFFIDIALRNIIKNAIEYSQKGGSVTITLSKIKHHVSVVVTDCGIGIPPEVLHDIYNRFQRSRVSSTKRKEGLGLGLSIVKQIVDLHHGTINITSQESVGTTVTLDLSC
ncbi:MAG: HAMP domain-containing sensor histidine kinase [Microgenomates group bacterium]